MRWAFEGRVDDPNARASIGQQIDQDDVAALTIDGQVIEVEDMRPLSDPLRGGILYLCIGCGGAVQRMRSRGYWRVRHSGPHNCDFLGNV